MSDSAAQRDTWALLNVKARARTVGLLRHVIAEDPDRFINAITIPHRRDAAETLAAELTPLAEACRFLQQRAHVILRNRRVGAYRRPIWLFGVTSEVRREPWGRVLILAPSNYPLMLAGIQTIQALVAGNAVMLKPAPGCSAIGRVFVDSLYEVGVPTGVLTLLDEDPSKLDGAFSTADKVILTGSRTTGRAVLARLTDRLTPSVMELSGCDAVFVQSDADLALAARCLAFGLSLNSSATCMAPRRIFANERIADALVEKLRDAIDAIGKVTVSPDEAQMINELAGEALTQGASIAAGTLPVESSLVLDHCTPAMRIMQADLMAPATFIVRTKSDAEAIAQSNQCEYRLGATIFGQADTAMKLASRLDVGGVIINDMIVPSADARLPFGGRGGSGFGITRGAEGLLDMTRPKTVIIRRGGPMPYLGKPKANVDAMLRGYLKSTHSRRWSDRARALIQLAKASRSTSVETQS